MFLSASNVLGGGEYFFSSAEVLAVELVEEFRVPNKAPTFTVSPSFTEILSRVPLEGAGTSTLTLSVSNSTIASSALTLSPSFFNHLATVASVTDSPSTGTSIRSDIN